MIALVLVCGYSPRQNCIVTALHPSLLCLHPKVVQNSIESVEANFSDSCENTAGLHGTLESSAGMPQETLNHQSTRRLLGKTESPPKLLWNTCEQYFRNTGAGSILYVRKGEIAMGAANVANKVRAEARLKLTSGPDGQVLTANVPPDFTEKDFVHLGPAIVGVIRRLTGCPCMSGRIRVVLENDFIDPIRVDLNRELTAGGGFGP